MRPTLRIAIRESLVGRTSLESARSTPTWSPASFIATTEPMRMPLTWTSSLTPRPPVWSNRTRQTFDLRPSWKSFSQVTPPIRIARAASTVMPTWISVLRLKRPPVSQDDRPLARALDELPHQGILRVPHFVRRSLEHHPALVEHRDPIRHLVGARNVVRHHHRGHSHALLKAADQLVDRVGHDRVESRGRLIVQDELVVHGDRPGEAYALPRCSLLRRGLSVLDV